MIEKYEDDLYHLIEVHVQEHHPSVHFHHSGILKRTLQREAVALLQREVGDTAELGELLRQTPGEGGFP